MLVEWWIHTNECASHRGLRVGERAVVVEAEKNFDHLVENSNPYDRRQYLTSIRLVCNTSRKSNWGDNPENRHGAAARG